MQWLATADPQSLGLPIDQIDSNNNMSFLLLHSGLDVNSPPSQSTLFYQALVNAGVPAQIKIYPDRDHLTLAVEALVVASRIGIKRELGWASAEA